MTTVNLLLKQLTSNLREIKLEDCSSLRKLVMNEEGNFYIKMSNGVEHCIPGIQKALNENVLQRAVVVSNEMKKRGFLGGVFNFFRLMTVLISIVIISTFLLAILAIKALLKYNSSKECSCRKEVLDTADGLKRQTRRDD